jgi:hypothetical protein
VGTEDQANQKGMARQKKEKKSLKIGVQFLAYNCKKSFPEFIKPWKKLKDEYNLYFYVGSCQFPIYANLGYEDNNASTVEMLKNEYSNIIDYLYTPSKPKKEEDLRNKCLEVFKGKGVDLMWVVDSDEFFTEKEICNVLDYVRQNNHIDWYSLQYKNYVGDGEGWVDFEAPRLWWMNRNKGIRSFHRDCWVIYNNEKECRQANWKTIPKKIAVPRHMTWVASFDESRPSDVRAKIRYQNINYSDGCGFKWDEKKGELSFNEEWLKTNNKKMPKIHSDEIGIKNKGIKLCE